MLLKFFLSDDCFSKASVTYKDTQTDINLQFSTCTVNYAIDCLKFATRSPTYYPLIVEFIK